MKISFVLPAYNEERLIGRAIESIGDAIETLDLDAEIIVADDGSEDRTAKIAAELGARVITATNRQISATRNLGARHASGDVLVFVDGDSAVSTELVRQTIDAIDAGVAGGGSRCAFDGRIPLWARAVKAVVFPVYALAGLTPGAYLFATRAAFDRAGGFDETVFAGEEVLMARALREHGRFVVVQAAVLTSGRKLRVHSAAELLGTLLHLGVRGRRGVADRARLGIWYGPRRVDLKCPLAEGERTRSDGSSGDDPTG